MFLLAINYLFRPKVQNLPVHKNYDLKNSKSIKLGSQFHNMNDVEWVKDENGELVCVCEIGYTSANKIKAYKDLGITDIRWYSKSLDLVFI